MQDYAARARKQNTSINPVGGRLPITPPNMRPKGLSSWVEWRMAKGGREVCVCCCMSFTRRVLSQRE